MAKHGLVSAVGAFVLAVQLGLPAADATTIGYQLGISTDLDLLRQPNDPASQLAATWKTSSEIAVARQTPLFRLTNTSSDANVNRITIRLSDTDFLFDAVVIAESPVGMAPIVESPGDVVQGQSTSSMVSFSFGDRPLLPNESFAFWVDIDPAAAAPAGPIDFRDILWDRAGNAREDNALVEVVFDQGQSDSVPLFEFAMQDQQYVPSPADGTTGQSMVLPARYGSDAIGAFFVWQSLPLENAPAPEPGSALLLAAGLWCLAAFRYRRK